MGAPTLTRLQRVLWLVADGCSTAPRVLVSTVGPIRADTLILARCGPS